jgi:hypothetical protein
MVKVYKNEVVRWLKEFLGGSESLEEFAKALSAEDNEELIDVRDVGKIMLRYFTADTVLFFNEAVKQAIEDK